VSDDTTVRASTARVGILVVVLATGARAALIVVGLLVMTGVVSTEWATTTIIPVLPIDDATGRIAFVVLLVLLVASAASVFGLWRRLTWGWTLSIVTAGSVLALDLGWWLAGDPRYWSMLVNAIAVFYLNQRDVRSIFKV
jgi:hypothetical protein